MKSLKNINETYTPKEIAESLIFPGTKDPKERAAMLSGVRELRKKIAEKQTEKDKVISQLLQLKFLMEDYLHTDTFNENCHFGYFLKEYIKRLDIKNKKFAEEIDLDATELSQIINKHRKPSEKLIFRLEIHSNQNFPAVMWYRLMEKDRLYELLHDKKIINEEKKHVKRKLEFSF